MKSVVSQSITPEGVGIPCFYAARPEQIPHSHHPPDWYRYYHNRLAAAVQNYNSNEFLPWGSCTKEPEGLSCMGHYQGMPLHKAPFAIGESVSCVPRVYKTNFGGLLPQVLPQTAARTPFPEADSPDPRYAQFGHLYKQGQSAVCTQNGLEKSGASIGESPSARSDDLERELRKMVSISAVPSIGYQCKPFHLDFLYLASCFFTVWGIC